MNRMKGKIARKLCVLLVWSLLVVFTGCSASNTTGIQKSSITTNLSVQSASSNLSQPQAEEIIAQMQAKQRVTLPDGKLWDGSSWNGLTVQLWVMGVASDTPLTSVIGNHADVISQEDITLQNGLQALLVLVDRSQPAAEEEATGSNIHTSEYWLIQHQLEPYPGRDDSKLAYVLQAAFTSSPSEARANLLKLAEGWKTK